jgi:hypothetical protein
MEKSMENPWFPKDSRTIITNCHQLSTGIPRLRSQEKVEAAQLELERHRKELQRKKEEVQLWGDSGDRSETSAADSEWQRMAIPRHLVWFWHVLDALHASHLFSTFNLSCIQAEVKVTEMDQKAQATGIWSQEVRSKCIRWPWWNG